MSQPETAIALDSGTESEDGLREQLDATAAASNDDSDGDDALLRTPVRLAAKADPQTPGTRALRLPGTPAKRKDPPPRLPPLNGGEDSDGAQASSVADVCPPRAAEQAPIKSPIGSPDRGGPSGAARRREAHDAALPSLNDGEDSDGAQASSAASVCPPRAADRAPMKPPTGSPEQGTPSGAAPSGAARRREARDASASSALAPSPSVNSGKGKAPKSVSFVDLTLGADSSGSEDAVVRVAAVPRVESADEPQPSDQSGNTTGEHRANESSKKRKRDVPVVGVVSRRLCCHGVPEHCAACEATHLTGVLVVNGTRYENRNGVAFNRFVLV